MALVPRLRARHFEAGENGFARWPIVADLRELPTSENLLGRPEWQRRAACRGEGTELYVRGRDGGTYAKALELCTACVVRRECLEMALADDELVGLWGGTTGSERRRMRTSERSQEMPERSAQVNTDQDSDTP
jgi:WhiB family redox-sensing transcriptional regulator